MKRTYSILFLTRYDKKGSSSRYRFYQYLPGLSAQGFDCRVSYLFNNRYIERLYAAGRVSPLVYLAAFLKRFFVVFSVFKYDLVVIEKEVFPFFPPIAEILLGLFRVKYVVDFDDATHHGYDQHRNPFVRAVFGKKIDVVVKHASAVTVGNTFLYHFASRNNARRIDLVPTVIDLKKYPPAQIRKDTHPLRICWIGTPKTVYYLTPMVDALGKVCKRNNATLVVIGAAGQRFSGFPVEYVEWNENTEVRDIAACDVGIMPLAGTAWDFGKCGFKLIQYMACWLPVVGSPVGANCEIIQHGVNGYLAGDCDEWVRYLDILLKDRDLRYRMGREGRLFVENEYCLEKTFPVLAGIYKSECENSR